MHSTHPVFHLSTHTAYSSSKKSSINEIGDKGMRSSYVKMREMEKFRTQSEREWRKRQRTMCGKWKKRMKKEKKMCWREALTGVCWVNEWRMNDQNQNLHETNMILTENLLNSVQLQDKLLLQLYYESWAVSKTKERNRKSRKKRRRSESKFKRKARKRTEIEKQTEEAQKQSTAARNFLIMCNCLQYFFAFVLSSST